MDPEDGGSKFLRILHYRQLSDALVRYKFDYAFVAGNCIYLLLYLITVGCHFLSACI